MRPLEGLTVIDLTRLLPGAAATMLLANFGAEVIKIEEPGGDYARRMPPLVEGEGAVFRATNRGKKSIVLNLKAVEGKEALRRLAARADVLIEGFRPGVMRRLGLDYHTLRATNEKLIYVSLTGYGQTGPLAALAGHDINYLAHGGLLDITGAIPGTPVADLAGGSMQAVIGILLALAARQKTGRGQFVDVSMLDGVAWLMTLPLAIHAATGELSKPGTGILSGRYACYQLYRTGDGRLLAVGALEPKFWRLFCEKIGRRDFVTEQFSATRQEAIIHDLREIFLTKSSAEWLQLFGADDVCVTLVRTVAEVAAGRRGEVIPRLSDTPGRVGERAPKLGENEGG